METPFVCVVDGDAAVRDGLATLITMNGRNVLTFATGRDFLDSVPERVVGWVVCEAELPDTSGIELFRSFHAIHPETRFALLLSCADPATAARARSFGVDEVLQKPLLHRRLTSFVNR